MRMRRDIRDELLRALAEPGFWLERMESRNGSILSYWRIDWPECSRRPEARHPPDRARARHRGGRPSTVLSTGSRRAGP